MQRLLQRSTSSSLLCTLVGNTLLSRPVKRKPDCFISLSLGFYTTKTPLVALTPKLEAPLSKPMAAALTGGGSSLSSSVVKNGAIGIIGPPLPTRFSSMNYVPCYCATKSSQTPFRGLVVFRPLCTVTGPEGVVTAAAASAVDGIEASDDGDGEKGDKGSQEKAVAHRRQKGSNELVGNADLLTIPGVGPKNLRKLVDKGFRGMAELKQLYKDKFLGKADETMVQYLQSSVGIIHRNHAESISNFIKESVDEELKELDPDVKFTPKKRITFCVEGNISVGKTTFLQRIVSDTIELQDLVEVVPEPIAKWQDIGPDHFNILDAFYAAPERYAYTFQNYVFVTRVMQERESSGGLKPLRLMERSVFSDRMVFVRAVHEAKWMNEMEISIYDSWFDPVVSVLPGLIPDGFIYLRATPDTCHQRMKLRRRAEEGGVSLDYLRDLHEKHESWLFPSQSGNRRLLSVSEPPLLLDSSIHPNIKDRVFYLEGDHMHSSIQKVPALILDCEANIDFNRDIEAKEHYARQVAEFFKYVKKLKEASPAKANEDTHIGNQRQLILPRQGGFFIPSEKHFPESALKLLEFRRAMSFMSGQ